MVERRELKNKSEDRNVEVFEKALAFHNTKTNVVIVLYGILKNKNYWGHRQFYDAREIEFGDLFEMFPATFWRLVLLEEVIEIDVTELPGIINPAIY